MQDQSQLYAEISAWGSWAAVGCALLIVWLQNRSAKRLTCLELFIQLAAQYDSVDMQNIRGRLADRLLTDPTTLEIEDSLLVFFENVAILARRNLLDRELVWNTFSFDMPIYWCALRHYVEHSRNKFSEPSLFEEFEKLVETFLKTERSPMGTRLKHQPLSETAVLDFLRYESLRGAKP